MSAINWIVPKRGGSTGRPSTDYAFSIGEQVCGKPGKRETQGAIRISVAAMKHLRWIGGDRVLIGFGPDGFDVYMKRVKDGGYALSPVGGKENTGKTVACTVKSSRLVFPRKTDISMNDFLVSDDGTVMFTLREKKP
jgi:hypothetical protein